jgi:cell division protein FtsL
VSLFLLFIGCDRKQEKLTYARLQQWDALLERHPDMVLDSLQAIEPEKLSQANSAYYGLLKTIVDDKTYTEFSSDSLITETEQYYWKSQPGSIDHIRSLIYRSIVGIRMGHIDTMTYKPLKEAEKLFNESKVNNFSAGYLIHYHLGDMHYSHNNPIEANHYYLESLRFAELENNKTHIFDAYTALFWNEMKREDTLAGKMYLDKLLAIENISRQEEYNLLNMQSTYYLIQGNDNLSLQLEMQMSHLLPFVLYKVDESHTFFSISTKYKSLNQVDSAMYYGLQAIQQNKDSTYRSNYLLYQNIADIALLRDDYKMAEEYRKKMFESYQKSVDERVDKRILELEKLYNLTEAENKALKAESKAKILLLLLFLLILILSFVLFVYSKRKRMAKLKNDILQAEKLAIESQALLLQNKATEQSHRIKIFSLYLTQYSENKQLMSLFEMKIRGGRRNKNELADDFKKMIEQGKEQFNDLSNQLFLSQISNNLIELSSEQNFLNEGDHLLLAMLAMKLENSQIAAFLNINLVNLKSRKTYLKKKLKENASSINNFEQIMSLF